MSTQVQHRRGTTAEHATFTGAVGEVTVDTSKDTVVVHDGATAGGFPLSLESHAHAGTYQPLDADLTALAGSPSTAGLVERTGAATYTTRAIGVAAGTDVPTRADADTRYAAASHAHAQADVTGLVADLALKAPLASPTFTGVPAMPTAAPGTNTTQGATTAFVTAAVAAGGGGGVSDADKGDITVSGGGLVWTIDNDAVTYAKIQDVSATDKLLGRSTAGSGVIEEIACTAAARSVLDDASVSAMVDTLGGAAATGTGGLVRMTAPTLTSPILPSASPSAPSAGNVTVYGADIAGRVVPAFVGADNAAAPFSPHLGVARRMDVMPSNNSSTPTTIGGVFAISGTATPRSVSAGSVFSWSRRLSLVSSSSAGSSTTLRPSTAGYGLGDAAGAGGFTLVARFGIADAAVVANARMFVGMYGTVAAIGNVEPSSLANIIGVGCDAGVTTLHIMHNDGSGTATTVDLGANFPTNTRSTDVYELFLYAKPNASAVGYRVRRVNTGDVASGTISTDLPANTALLGPQLWRNNGSTALAVDLAFMGLYLETDN